MFSHTGETQRRCNESTVREERGRGSGGSCTTLCHYDCKPEENERPSKAAARNHILSDCSAWMAAIAAAENKCGKGMTPRSGVRNNKKKTFGTIVHLLIKQSIFLCGWIFYWDNRSDDMASWQVRLKSVSWLVPLERQRINTSHWLETGVVRWPRTSLEPQPRPSSPPKWPVTHYIGPIWVREQMQM